MATAGEGRATYESSGAGGKFRKRPLRRSAQATPYDRPPTALRNNKPGLLTKLVDPASRLIYAGAHKLFGVFRKRLPPLSLQGPPEINEEPQNVSQESRRNNSTGVSKQDGDSASISAATGISELEQMLKQKTFSRSEIQHLTELLHSRTTESPFENMVEINKASPSSLLMLEASTSGSMKKHRDNSYNFHAAMSTPLISSKVVEERTPSSPAELAKAYMATSLHKPQPITSMTPNPKVSFNFKGVENGFLTPRSRGRSAMYSMARTPYSKTSSSNFNQKGAIMTSYSSQSLKRRSSVLDDDFGSVGPLRRTRQKPNLLSQSRYKSELGYTTFQQPPNEPEEKSKSKSTLGSVPEKSTQTATTIFQQLERLTPPKSPTKLTSSMLHGQALRSLEKVDSIKSSEVQVRDNNGESASTSTSTSKGKEKVEENGSRKFPVPVNMLTTTVNGDVAVSVKESEQIVVNDDLDLKLPPEPPQKRRAFCMSAPDVDDDDDDDDVDDVIHVNGHENNKPVSADIIEPPTPPEVSKTPVVVAEVAKVSEPVELKEPEKAKPPPLKTDGNVIEQETGFKFPTSTFTTQKDKVTPTENVLPFQFSDFKPKESLGPKPVDSASVFSSDQFKVTNKDENGNDQKVENSPAAMFSFASSAKNSSGPTPTMTPDSGPSVFSSSTPFPASDGNTNLLFNNTSNSNITPATSVLSTSLPTPVFSFGSANKPTTSVAETSNTDAKPTSVFAATTTTAPTGGGGLFGFSSPAATSTATTTTTTNAGALFGFSAPAATSTAITTTTTTTNGGGLFATSTTTPTTTTNGGALFGFSSPAATSTTTTATNGGAPFGFSAPAATSTTTTATTTNGGAYFGFSAPAATSTTTNAATTNGNLFGFSAPAATSTTTTTTAPFFNTTTTSQTTTQPSSTPITQSSPFQFGSGSTTSPFGSSSTFNITSMAPTSDPKPGNSTSGPTTTVFGSSWQTPNPNPNPNPSVFSFGASSSSATTPPITFGASNPSTGPTTFSFNTSGPTKPSFTTTSQVFGTPTTVFANNNNNNNNDQMSMEDSMAEDSNPVSPFGQAAAPVAAVAPPGFMFGSGPPPQQVAAPFQFGGGQTNQVAPPQNPFQSSSLEFNGGGGSFSLGSGGDKSGRRIVRVNKSKNRRK